MKQNARYIALLVALFALLVAVQFFIPKPVNWEPSFSREEKIPYGCFILYDLLPQIFPNAEVSAVREPVYNTLANYRPEYWNYTPPPMDTTDTEYSDSLGYPPDSMDYGYNPRDTTEYSAYPSDTSDYSYYPPDTSTADFYDANAPNPDDSAAYAAYYDSLDAAALAADTSLTNYVFIGYEFEVDSLDTKTLLNYVGQGNTAFIAARYFNRSFTDTMHCRPAGYANFFGFEPEADSAGKTLPLDSVGINFTNPNLKAAEDYRYNRQAAEGHFAEIDTAHSIVLGKNARGDVNFIKVQHGSGAFYISAVPFAFTNYNALFRNNLDYISKSLSHLPVRKTYWDEYYKLGRAEAHTPLRYILSQEALRWAYYAVLAGVALYVLFESKRRQRIIPVLRPLVNTTVEFVETVGRLYYQTGLKQSDHKDIAAKKITYFLEHIRSVYFLKTNVFNAEFLTALSQKSGIAPDEIKTLFQSIERNTNASQTDEPELKLLTERIDTFYRNTRR